MPVTVCPQAESGVQDTQQRLETAEHLVHSLYPGAVMSTPETPLGPPNAPSNQNS